MKWDAERRLYDIVVIGEEQHLAYNRVGLSTFFEHRKIEDLYLNSQEWVSGRSSAVLWFHCF
jgi:nitrite reductase (NAD(P)H)